MGDYSEAIVLTVAVLASAFIVKHLIDAVVRIMADRRAALPTERESGIAQRLERIEAAVDAIALEVERVGESQRFSTRLLHGEGALDPAPAARQRTPV
jgi:hypothetical protein